MTHFPSSQPITRARGYRWVLSISAALSVLLTGCGQGGGESAAPETPTAASPSAEQPDTAALTRAARQRFSAMLDAHAAAFVAQAPEFATQLGLSEAVAGAGYASRLSSHSFAA
ncbi:MAG: hypothetical protein AAFR72_07795, partial [Pseudomonadota bacterium]